MKFVISKGQWETIGKEAGWLSNLADVFAPEQANPYVMPQDGQNEKGQWVINPHKLGVINPEDLKNVTVEQVEKLAHDYHTSDTAVLMGIDKALRFMRMTQNAKLANQLKILLYKMFILKGTPEAAKCIHVLKQWAGATA